MKTSIKIGILSILLFSGLAEASVIVGSDGSGPVQFYAPDGTPVGPYGSSDGTAGAPDGLGGLFVAIPGETSSTIDVYGPAQTLLSSFFFTSPGDTEDFGPYITDVSWGAAGTLWVSTYTGYVYNLAADGTVLRSFDTGTTSPGVAFDGTDLYTTSGPGFSNPSPFVYVRDTSGNILNTIDTGLNDTLGIGYDPSNSSLWIGGFDVLTQVDLSGNILQSFSIDGTHYGVEVGDVSTPEPYTWTLMLTGFLGLVAWKSREMFRGAGKVLLAAVSIAPMMHGAVSIASFTPSPAGPQPVGTSITFTASASDTDPGALRYRYRVQPSGGSWIMLSDYSPSSSVVWTPADTDGTYQIEVSVLNHTTLNTQASAIPFTVSSRVTGSTPVVNPTSHPLVALYSGPSCAAGSTMRVRFKLPSDTLWQSTALKNCNGATSMNFYIAGMRASTTYQMRQDVITGPRVVSGATLSFTTGPAGITIPTTTATLPLKAPSSTTEPVTLFSGLNYLGSPSYAVDAAMNLIWYAPPTQVYLTRPVPGGGYMVTYGFTADLPNSGLREYDLAGNLVIETNVERMNDQLAAVSMSPITVFHHEIRKLANGNFMVLGQRELVSSVQGAPNDIAGDMILILDSNLQLLWSWDSFAHLDLTRPAVLGETCTNGPGQCVLLNGSIAHDWTHGNSAALTPDGNIVYSSRHQDFAYKIAYQNGAGDGHVIWKLGKGGDFTWISSDPYPWFSHQHDVEYEDATTLSLFDDGNTRVVTTPGNSRGQALTLDETNLIVTPILMVDVGSYSFALGSAQRLTNGDYVFDSGLITQVTEWSPTSAAVSNLASPSINYRSFRLRDLYSAPY